MSSLRLLDQIKYKSYQLKTCEINKDKTIRIKYEERGKEEPILSKQLEDIE